MTPPWVIGIYDFGLEIILKYVIMTLNKEGIMGRKSRKDIIAEGQGSVDWDAIARECIRVYFSNKSWFCGGPIPSSELYSKHSIQTVLLTRFDDQWEEVVHGQCLPRIKNNKNEQFGNLSWEIHCLLEILKEMGSLWVPPEFRPGMTLLYFKFCKGVAIPNTPHDYYSKAGGVVKCKSEF
jgi:hypothetical protein